LSAPAPINGSVGKPGGKACTTTRGASNLYAPSPTASRITPAFTAVVGMPMPPAAPAAAGPLDHAIVPASSGLIENDVIERVSITLESRRPPNVIGTPQKSLMRDRPRTVRPSGVGRLSRSSRTRWAG
jgi:hypothetical protein